MNGAPPLARVTTASLEALRKYSEANRANDIESDYPKAVRLLREAIAIDTLFAEAWRKLGASMSNLGMPPSEVNPVLARAFALRDRLAERDRERVIGTYYSNGPGRDRAKAIESYERLLARGDSDLALGNLAVRLNSRREFTRAESLYRAAVRRVPGVQNMANLVTTLEHQGKWSEADSVFAVARVRFPRSTRFPSMALDRLLARGEMETFRHGVDSARRVTDASNPSGATFRAAQVPLLEGRLGEWKALLAQGWRLDSTVGVNAPPIFITGAAFIARVGLQLPFANELQAYEAQLEKTPWSSMPESDVPYLDIVGWFARAGRLDQARASLAEYQKVVTDTSLRRVQQPALHLALAEIASTEGKWEEAARGNAIIGFAARRSGRQLRALPAAQPLPRLCAGRYGRFRAGAVRDLPEDATRVTTAHRPGLRPSSCDSRSRGTDV